MEASDRGMIHYTELPPAQPGSALAVEWELYRREVGQLLAERHEGHWVLIKGEEVLGFFESREAAIDEAYERFPFPREPFLVHQVQTRERLIGPLRGIDFPLKWFITFT
jgi:hypothetical protein